jgi:hypothetical protein
VVERADAPSDFGASQPAKPLTASRDHARGSHLIVTKHSASPLVTCHNSSIYSEVQQSKMGAVEHAVDAAADFVGPFVDASRKESHTDEDDFEVGALIRQAIAHLQAIHDADLDADPDAPYDASLAGVVYGLLDIVIVFGVLPNLSPGVAFSQRPRSVLTAVCPSSNERDTSQLLIVANTLVPLLEQMGCGVQPLLSQRILPDLISVLAELSFSPMHRDQQHSLVQIYEKVIEATPTSRLLPILTTFLQQPLPAWLKPRLSRELAMVPLRQRGIRHTIEFLSLSYLSKTSQMPQDASGSQSQIPIPLEAVTQASRLLVLPPAKMNRDEWLCKLAPQLQALLDGDEGVELSRAAGQIIAEGLLSKRATGSPNSTGWHLFALPLLQTIRPKETRAGLHESNDSVTVLVQEHELELALKRLSAIISSYSHAGLLKRLLSPVLLSVWALLNYAHERPALNRKWIVLSRSILIRYMAIVCEPSEIYQIATKLFWDGEATWCFKPGSQGGIEIRRRSEDDQNSNDMNNILARIGSLGSRIGLLVSLLDEAKAPDDAIGLIFLQATKRWLSPMQDTKTYLTDGYDTNDPFAVLTDAKLSEAMGTTFRAQLARNPQHVVELMGQLLLNFTRVHQTKVQKLTERNKLSRVNLRNLIKTENEGDGSANSGSDTADEELVSLAISILSTLVSSAEFKQTPATQTVLASVVASLDYLVKEKAQTPISPLIVNSARSLLQLLQPPPTSPQTRDTDTTTEARATLKTILGDLTSIEPPNRTWALDALRKFMQDPTTFSVMDVPSMAHLLLSASLADPESYVHTAAMPVLVALAIRAPSPAVGIFVDAFIDIDEQSLKLARGRQTEEKDRELQHALDFRLRVGEVLNTFVLDDGFFYPRSDTTVQHRCLKRIYEACLSLASRRGKRTHTLSTRTKLAQAEQEQQDEAEAAWGGPIPNLLDPEGEGLEDQAERDEMLKIIQGWEDTGVEEDVRVRASALSVMATVVEHRLGFLRQVTVDAALQMVLLIVSMERTEAKAMLRRAAIMVVMGLLRGLDGLLEDEKESAVGLSIIQQNEVSRVLRWVGTEDTDALVRDHAASVLEGLETWRMKKLYQFRGQGLAMGAGLGLEGNLRGLQMQPSTKQTDKETKKLVVEELD